MSEEDMPMWRITSADEESALQGEYLDTEALCEIEKGKDSAKIVTFATLSAYRSARPTRPSSSGSAP